MKDIEEEMDSLNSDGSRLVGCSTLTGNWERRELYTCVGMLTENFN